MGGTYDLDEDNTTVSLVCLTCSAGSKGSETEPSSDSKEFFVYNDTQKAIIVDPSIPAGKTYRLRITVQDDNELGPLSTIYKIQVTVKEQKVKESGSGLFDISAFGKSDQSNHSHIDNSQLPKVIE